MKALMRWTGARMREGLVEAIGWAIRAVTAEDAEGFFIHCGYHLPDRYS
jgi:hypothetical protein